MLHEIPFDSDRKTMSVILRGPGGNVELYAKGAPEVILGKCTQERFAGQVLPLTSERREELLRAAGDMAARALRVLALAYRDGLPAHVDDVEDYDDCERELVLAGLVGMIDPPREEVKAAVAKCQAAGIRVVMITGDHPATALAIARELKIARSPDDVALTGRELDALERRGIVRQSRTRGRLRTGDGRTQAPRGSGVEATGRGRRHDRGRSQRRASRAGGRHWNRHGAGRHRCHQRGVGHGADRR